MKRLVFGVVTTLIAIILSLVCAEIILRVFWTPIADHSQTQELGPSAMFGHELVPGVSGVHAEREYKYPFENSPQGFRSNRLFARELPAGYTRRVLLLGDSFTYGMGVPREQTFASLLAERFPETEIINAGVAAYGQRNELAVLDIKGPSLSPDIVILFFFWNDLDDNVTKDKPDYRFDENGTIIRTDYVVPENYDPLAPRFEARPEYRPSWARKTYVYQLYKDGLAAIRHKYFGRTGWYSTNDTPEKLEHAWDVTYQYLQMIKMRTANLGAQLYIVHIPDYALVDETRQYKQLPKHIVYIDEGFERVCKKLDVPCVNLTPALISAAAASDEPLYYEDDRHLTAQGHRAVAEEVMKFLD